MASTLFRNLRFCSFCQPKKLERVLKCTATHRYEFSVCRQSVISDKQSNEQKWYTDGINTKYGILAIFTGISLFLYSCKDKLKIPTGWFPTVHAIARNDGSLRQRFNFIADVVGKTADAVVCIESRTLLRNGVQSVAPGGSGFIIKDDGLILTNAHVVMNRVHRTVQVKLKDGRIFTGEIEDVDVNTDLATVRIKADKLPMIDLGSSSDLRAGEWVVAIGSPLSLRDSVSAGVVSSPQRKGEDLGINFKDMQYIQTDAAITFGNSGGPLVNLDGEAVGVNSMKVTAGISFAIPIEYAKEFLRRCEEKKKSEEGASISPSGKRSYIGVSMLTLTAELLHDLNLRNYQIPEFLENGILICQVMIGSPAFNSGVQPGDIIAEINGKPVSGIQSVYRALESGSPLNMKIFRRNVFLSVIIAPQEGIGDLGSSSSKSRRHRWMSQSIWKAASQRGISLNIT